MSKSQWVATNYPPEFLSAFLAKAVPGSPGQCWIWQGSRDPSGYGRFTAVGFQGTVHRLAYALYIGNPPADQVVRHRCDTPPCWNPECLVLGTHQDNMDDKANKGRSAIEDRHPQRKLDSELACQIVHAYNAGKSFGVIAADIGFITADAVKNVVRGRTWKNATASIPRLPRATVQRLPRPVRERKPRVRNRPKKGEPMHGSAHVRAKINERQARELAERYIAGESITELAKRFGLSETSTSAVVTRKTWRRATEGLPLGEIDGKARQLAALPAARASRWARHREVETPSS